MVPKVITWSILVLLGVIVAMHFSDTDSGDAYKRLPADLSAAEAEGLIWEFERSGAISGSVAATAHSRLLAGDAPTEVLEWAESHIQASESFPDSIPAVMRSRSIADLSKVQAEQIIGELERDGAISGFDAASARTRLTAGDPVGEVLEWLRRRLRIPD
jgi:hypothetical protein